MCDFFWAKNGATNGEGDLSDIIRSAQLTNQSQPATWQLQAAPSILAEPSRSSSSSNGFGDPFEALREVLFEEVQDKELFEETKRPRVSLDEFRVSSMASNGDDQTNISGVVMGPVLPSELRGSGPGIKRRKGEAKKVVCIPAPVAIGATSANGKLASGSEVVPSDLWAWRKYGQKPIKGSPYPRGYYRCSSSKGCSAKKQVERSRTDPNMLVITYTSEHIHPWPTHRNALAGSTRGPLSKSFTVNPKITSFDRPMFQNIPSKVGATIKDEPNNMSVDDTRAELPNENLLKRETEPDPVCEMFSNGKGGEERVEKFMDPFSLLNWFGENNNNNNTSE